MSNWVRFYAKNNTIARASVVYIESDTNREAVYLFKKRFGDVILDYYVLDVTAANDKSPAITNVDEYIDVNGNVHLVVNKEMINHVV